MLAVWNVRGGGAGLWYPQEEEGVALEILEMGGLPTLVRLLEKGQDEARAHAAGVILLIAVRACEVLCCLQHCTGKEFRVERVDLARVHL